MAVQTSIPNLHSYHLMNDPPVFETTKNLFHFLSQMAYIPHFTFLASFFKVFILIGG